jgi:oxygen-dependent protoporphyrinogen oxidase
MERDHRSLILAMMRQSSAQKSGTSGARYSLFLSFDDGMEVLTNALAGVIPNVRLNTRVDAIHKSNGTWTITTDAGESLEADAICLAVPAYVAAKLLETVNQRLASQLSAIKYASMATINFAYRRAAISHPLDGFGFVVPRIEKRSLIACTFSSVKFPGRAPDDHVLLRAFTGGDMGTRIEADLRELLGINGKPLFTEVKQWERSMPQYEVGHLDRITEIENELERMPGLTIAGNAYRGVGIPDCIRSGETAAEKIIEA